MVSKSGHTTLLLLVGLLVCRTSFAVLQDRGPSDIMLGWPQWYRDTNGLALGMCKSEADAGNGPLCIGGPPEPKGFAGNLGAEAFHFAFETTIIAGDIDFLYIAALEDAYTGEIPTRGEEILFSRLRFKLVVDPARASQCSGTWRVIHPYGDEIFEDVEVPDQGRSIFVTYDVPGVVVGDFDGAIKYGDVGPFLRAAKADGTQAPDIEVGNERFIGDPNVESKFVGSPFTDANGKPQNYVEIQGPEGCDVDGNGNRVNRVDTGALVGQIWTADIPTPTNIRSAVYSINNGKAIIDVEAEAKPGSTLVITSHKSTFPSKAMVEDLDAGVGLNKFHGQVVVEDSAVLPENIIVVNTNSKPAVASPIARLTDIVLVGKAVYDPETHELCVEARSSDTFNNPALSLIHPGLPGFVTLDGSNDCTLDDYLCACVTLPNAGSTITSQGATVTVKSAKSGMAVADVEYKAKGDPITVPTDQADAPDMQIDNVATGGPSTLTISTFANSGSTSVVIVKQPPEGTITPTSNLGQVTFTPLAGINAGETEFWYVIQQGSVISNVAVVTLFLKDAPLPPITKPDAFPILVGTTRQRVVNVLANDVPVRGTTIDATTLAIRPSVIRGTVVTLTGTGDEGKVRYTAPASTGLDSFEYTVESTPGRGESLPTKVFVNVNSQGEAFTFPVQEIKAGAAGRWRITAVHTRAGWAGTITSGGNTFTIQTTLYCWLISRAGTAVTPEFIGSAPMVLNTAVANTPSGAIDVNSGTSVVRPDGTSRPVPSCSGTKRVTCQVQCGTNWAAALPTRTNAADTPILSIQTK